MKKVWGIFFSRTFFTYIIFGGLATIFVWGIFYLSTYTFEYNYLLSTLLGFSVGSIVNFSLNKYINFKNRYQKIKYQFALFLVIAIIGLGISFFIMWNFVGVLHFDKMISRILTTGIVLIYNFLGHKYITFRLLK
jgi:putative flippase GtrA